MEHPQSTESAGYYQNGHDTRPQLNITGSPLNGHEEPHTFPAETLPLRVRTLIEEADTALNLDPAFTGAAALAALSTAIGNSRELYLKRKMTHPAIIFQAIVGKPGSGKTPAHDLLFEPLKNADQTNRQKYDEEREQAENPDSVKLKRKLINDHTPEVLADIMTNNPRGICLYTDELATWFKNFNRYNTGADLERWLSIFSRSLYTVDRKSQPSISVPLPFCSVFGGIQPSVLPSLFQGDNGFTDRILFSLETPNRPADTWSDADVHEQTSTDYHSLIDYLTTLEAGTWDNKKLKPGTVTLTNEAMETWKNYYADLQSRMKQATEGEASLLAKLEQYTARLTLILALGNDPDTDQAGKKDLDAAIHLAGYFKGQANHVKEQAADPLQLNKRELVKYLHDAWNFTQTNIANGLGTQTSYINDIVKGRK